MSEVYDDKHKAICTCSPQAMPNWARQRSLITARYINLHFTYLLTYKLTAFCACSFSAFLLIGPFFWSLLCITLGLQ